MIDLDPGFRVGEEGELKLLRHDVMEEMLESHYDEGAEEYLDFVSAYGGGRNDRKIEDLILKIYEFSRSYPDAEGWLAGVVKSYDVENVRDLEGSDYVRRIKGNVSRYLEDAKELISLGLSLCGEADGPKVYEEALLSDMQMIESLKKEKTFEGLNSRMREVKWAKLAANRDKTVSEQKAGQVKAVREEVKGLVKDMASQYFYQDIPGMLEDMKRCRPHIEVLAGLVGEFSGRFHEKKREKEFIDFSDMEQYALQILTEREGEAFVPSAVAKEYQEQFLEIMIDEYQDSNLLQETILTSISTVWEGRYNIFMVGDVKQSIYRFRLSRPELFMEKFDGYTISDEVRPPERACITGCPDGCGIEGGKKQRIDLHKNFRSRKEVLDGINYIFRQIMTRGLGGIAYNDEAALYAGAEYPAFFQNDEGEEGSHDFPAGPWTEVLVIDADMPESEKLSKDSRTGEEGQQGQPVTERELEARAIAARIRELMRRHKVLDKSSGELRTLRYSDIVILVRSIRGTADVFAEILNKEGIPAYTGTKEGYFAVQEIGVLLDYLRVLDNEQQDIPLAAVLSSPFGGLTEEELAAIRSGHKDMPFHKAVLRYREEGGEARRKAEKCLLNLEKFREQVPYTPVHELLRRILSETGYGDFVSAMPGGAQRKANIDMLIERARAFESTSYKGLFHFVRYIEQLQKYDVDYGEAALNDEQSDTVRVMTVHKSKGLEFPVVFVSGLGKKFNMQEARSSVALHVGLGVGLDAVNLGKRTKSPSLVKKVIQKEEALDSLGEELRVLYVALTRAREKLILTGTLSNLEKKMENYELVRGQQREELSFARLSKAVSYMDWILPTLVRPAPEVPIRVHMLGFGDIVRDETEEEAASRMKRAALERWDTDKVYDERTREMMEEQFAFSYAYEGCRLQKIKYTVSELKKRSQFLEFSGHEQGPEDEFGQMLYEEPDIVPLVPKFLREEEGGLSGAFRGTAYHRLMELLDFGREHTEESLREELKKFIEEKKISAEMAESVRLGDILSFLRSSIGIRMRTCAGNGTLKREQPFVLGLEEDGEMILVQGIIDVCLEEEDGLTVVDYKTDKVRSGEELRGKYHAQLEYYAKALEQLTQKPVKEKIIYSFTLGEEISF